MNVADIHKTAVALTALTAVEHINGNDGNSLNALVDKIAAVAIRAGLTDPGLTDPTT